MRLFDKFSLLSLAWPDSRRDGGKMKAEVSGGGAGDDCLSGKGRKRNVTD